MFGWLVCCVLKRKTNCIVTLNQQQGWLFIAMSPFKKEDKLTLVTEGNKGRKQTWKREGKEDWTVATKTKGWLKKKMKERRKGWEGRRTDEKYYDGKSKCDDSNMKTWLNQASSPVIWKQHIFELSVTNFPLTYNKVSMCEQFHHAQVSQLIHFW